MAFKFCSIVICLIVGFTFNWSSVDAERATSFRCLMKGDFADQHDPQLHHQCIMVASGHLCDEGKVFDARAKKCVDKSTSSAALAFSKWSRAIKCTSEGVFRSAFDCRYFYQCRATPAGYIVFFKRCQDDQVFNEFSLQCATRIGHCHNLLTLPKHV